MTKENYLEILSHFLPEGSISDVHPFGNGHINDTLLVTDTKQHPRFVLQRINHAIFKDVDMLQNNIKVVTECIRRELTARRVKDIDRKVLTFLPADNGKTYYFDGNSYWRVSLFIPNSQSFDGAISTKLAYEAGQAFGDFQTMLANLPEGSLGETIPNFHNMEFRLEEFHQAIAKDPVHRVQEVKDLIDEIEKRSEAMCIQERLYREGKLKKRTNHCDTKVNNILFDSNDGNILCVIDLDTVMPGFVLSDIGDFIRTATNKGDEDDKDLTRVGVDIEIFKAYTKGYMEKAKAFLTPLETSLLPYGGRLLTYMQTVRFLTDYINGDTYYKIAYPEHNLVRTRAQYAMLQSLEQHKEEMDRFMDAWLK